VATPDQTHADDEPVPTARDVAEDLFTVYLGVGVGLGVLGGIFAASVHKIVQDETTILLAMAGADVVLLAVILTATALVAGLLQDYFERVIEKAAGLRGFFRPFRIMARVCASAALVSFAGAMIADSSVEWLRASVFGLAGGLTTWAIVGNVWLISIFMDQSNEQRKLAAAIKKFKEKRQSVR